MSEIQRVRAELRCLAKARPVDAPGRVEGITRAWVELRRLTPCSRRDAAEVAGHPDLAEMNVAMDGFYLDGPTP